MYKSIEETKVLAIRLPIPLYKKFYKHVDQIPKNKYNKRIKDNSDLFADMMNAYEELERIKAKAS